MTLRRLLPGTWLALLLTAGVFALDCVTPLGYAVPILYLIPLWVIGQKSWERGVYWFAGGATVLSVLGYHLGPAGGLLTPALFNRASSVVVLWGAAVVLSSEKRTEWKLGQQADLTRAILEAVTAQVTLIDRQGHATEFLSGQTREASGEGRNRFIEELQSVRWLEVTTGSGLKGSGETEDYLGRVWEVVQGRRRVYSAEYGQVTPAGFRWYLLYARALRSQEGAVVASIDITDRHEAQQALREREQEVQLLLDAREALARDLHDEVIQRLYAIGLNLTAWRRRHGEVGSPIASRFGEVIFDVDQVIQQVRRYLDGSPQSPIAGKDLCTHVQALIGSMTKDTAIASAVTIDQATASQLGPAQVPHVLAIIREAVSNTLQHAAAGRVAVRLQQEDESALLTIEDNGHGFDPAHTSAGRGRGLVNLRARAGIVKGCATVSSRVGRGTRIRVQIPLEVGCETR
jgi:signal transduction histidine kinase